MLKKEIDKNHNDDDCIDENNVFSLIEIINNNQNET